MTENSARTSVIALLEKLGSEDDAEVLAAARWVNAKVSEMGVTWEELLVPDDDSAVQPVRYADSDDADDEGSDEADDAGDVTSGPGFAAVDDTSEDINRIEQMKAIPGISDALREELDDYLADIKEKEFTASDRQYLQALQQRLSKGARKTG
jgi:hypothetical protein